MTRKRRAAPQRRGKRLAIAVHDAAPGHAAPARTSIRKWASVALAAAAGEVTVRIVTAAESAELNARYRGRSGATNVLSFPAGEALPLPEGAVAPLGDVVVCAEVVAREAHEQDKPVNAHWAHMLIHGALHLLGYDHMTASETRRMETRERELLAALGFADPYAPRVGAGSARRVACKPRARPAR